jgi:hypothetical protein
MTCRQLRPYIVDFARGAGDGAAVEPHIVGHLRGCRDCAALLERERILSAALFRVATAVTVPPAAPERERALLEGFDRARADARPSTRQLARRWVFACAAALLAAAGFTGWRIVRVSPVTPRATASHAASREVVPLQPPHGESAVQPPAIADAALPDRRRTVAARRARAPRRPAISDAELAYLETPFVAWPGAEAAPVLESGSVVRTRLPAAILPALGLWPPSSAGADVTVDMLIGQDGFARAVRLVKE